MTRFPILALLVSGCGQVPQCYSPVQFNFTRYSVTVTAITAAGLQVDDPRSELDQAQLDSVVGETTACVARVWPTLTTEQRAEAQCYGSASPDAAACLTYTVPPDWRVSECTGEQVFPCSVPFASCAAKGQTPGQCPCSCRAMLQAASPGGAATDALVTAPNLKLLPANLVTALTGCNQPWVGPLAECATARVVSP